jgi:phosphoglycolate phosphatase
MAITQLFFDLDGTLVDSFPGIALSAETALAQVLPGRQAPDLLPFIGPPIREIFRRALPENDFEILDRLELSFRTSYNATGWRKTQTYPGVKEVLARVCHSNHVCRLLTNKPKQPTEAILHHLGLSRFFNEVITPDFQTPAYSSKVAAARDAQRRHALAGGQALVVGDSADDGAAAAACGFKFAATAYGYGKAFQTCDSPVHFRLERIEDLLQIL